jgi:hypothetical protein
MFDASTITMMDCERHLLFRRTEQEYQVVAVWRDINPRRKCVMIVVEPWNNPMEFFNHRFRKKITRTRIIGVLFV